MVLLVPPTVKVTPVSLPYDLALTTTFVIFEVVDVTVTVPVLLPDPSLMAFDSISV